MHKNFLFLLVHNSEFLENPVKNYCIRPHYMWSRAEWVNPLMAVSLIFQAEAYGVCVIPKIKLYPKGLMFYIYSCLIECNKKQIMHVKGMVQ